MLITQRDDRNGLRLDVMGPLVAGPAHTMFRQAILQVVRAGYRRIVVNLNGMPSIDAAGIGAIAEAAGTAQPLGVDLIFAELTPRVRHLLAVTGLLAVLTVADSADDLSTVVEAAGDPVLEPS